MTKGFVTFAFKIPYFPFDIFKYQCQSREAGSRRRRSGKSIIYIVEDDKTLVFIPTRNISVDDRGLMGGICCKCRCAAYIELLKDS